jgi:hypothetical protein
MELKCYKCDYTGMPDVSRAGDHIKASCAKCYAYIKFVPYKDLDEDDFRNLRAWEEKETGAEGLNEYKRGFLDGVECFAHWKDGVKYVGTCGMTLQTAHDHPELLEGYKEKE